MGNLNITASQPEQQIHEAVKLLRAGGVVAFPTETVYGLGADAANPDAVAKIFDIKGRPADHPLIVHLASADLIEAWAQKIPPEAYALAERFWPGPLTIILERQSHVPDVVTGGLATVGLRVPRHATALALLTEFGGGLAAPSANRFGRVSPTRSEHVWAEFGAEVEIVLDGGNCEVGLESTIVDLSSSRPALLRPGAVTLDDIEEVLDRPLSTRHAGSPRAPGQLASHYAPAATVQIVSREQLVSRAQELADQGLHVAVLSDERLSKLPRDVVRILLSSDPNKCARQLYDALREVDHQRCDIALVALPEEEGVGAAIADRLRKASGPRIVHRS